MAIDTFNKRLSILGLGNSTIKHVRPRGSVDLASRTTYLDLYEGLSLEVSYLQKEWDYSTENALTLKVSTSAESLQVNPDVETLDIRVDI